MQDIVNYKSSSVENDDPALEIPKNHWGLWALGNGNIEIR